MGKRDQSYPAPKTNLCVVYEKQYGRARRRVSCKKMPPVTTVAEAKQTAYRVARKLKLEPGMALAITLGRQHEGQIYWFHVEHGRVTCRKGSMFGPKCG
jgi:D-lyxose ketol-isomerase